MRIRFHRFSRKNYFYDRIAWILGANFRFRANIQGNLFPPIVVQEGWFVLSERHNFGETTK